MTSQPQPNVNVDTANRHLTSVPNSKPNDPSAPQVVVSRPVTPLSRTFPLSNVAEKETFGTAVLSAGSDAVQMARAARVRSRSEAKQLQMPRRTDLSSITASPIKGKGKARARSPDTAQPSSDDTLLGSWDTVGPPEANLDSPSAARRSRMNSVSGAAGDQSTSPTVLTELSLLLEEISINSASQGQGNSPSVGTQRHRSESHELPKYTTGVPLFPHNAFSPQPGLDTSLTRQRASTFSVPLGTATPKSTSRARAGSILHRAPSPLGTPASSSSRGGGLNYTSLTPSTMSIRSSQASPFRRSPPAPPLAANEPFPETLASPRPPQTPQFASSYEMQGPFQSSPYQPKLYAPTRLRSRSSLDTSFGSSTSGSAVPSPELSMTASTRADSSFVDTPDTSAGSIPSDVGKTRDVVPSSIGNESVQSQELSVSFDSRTEDSPSDVKSQRRTSLLSLVSQEEGETRRKSAPVEHLSHTNSDSRSSSNSLAAEPAITRPKSHTITGDECHRSSINVPVLDIFGSAAMGPWTPNTSPQLEAAASAAYSSSSLMREQQDSSSDPLLESVSDGFTSSGDLPRPRSNTINTLALHSPTSKRSNTVPGVIISGTSSLDSVSQDHSLTAFDELVESTLKHPSTSGGEAQAIASALGAGEYRRSSPTLADAENLETRSACELCACLCIALTTLEPCGHRACPTCTSSGINQVSTSPPRKHTCAACHMPVQSISLGIAVPSASLSNIVTVSASKTRTLSPTANQSEASLDEVVLKTMAPYGDAPASSVEPEASRPTTARPATVHQKTGTLSGGARSFFSMQVGAESKTDKRQSSLSDTAKSYEQGQRHKASASQRTAVQKSDASSVARARDLAVAAIQHPSNVNVDTAATVGQGRVFSRSASSVSYAQQPFALPHEFDDDIDEDEDLHTDAGTFVVRIDNIPWTVSYKDVAEWLSQENVLPPSDKVPHAVHIPIELPTGKTANSCFIECTDKPAAMKVIRKLNNARLCGRPVSLILSNHRELLDEVFPSRAQRLFGREQGKVWFSAWELSGLLHLLQQGSTQLKGPVKVVEHFTSMMRLLPAEGIAHDLRDLFFERACEFVAVCVRAVSSTRGLRTALDRLLHQVAQCSALTVTQKIRIFETAKQTLHVPEAIPAARKGLQSGAQQSSRSPFVTAWQPAHAQYPSRTDVHGQHSPAIHSMWNMPTSMPYIQPGGMVMPPQPLQQAQFMPLSPAPGMPHLQHYGEPTMPFPMPYAPHLAYTSFASGASMPGPAPQAMVSQAPEAPHHYAATAGPDTRLAMMTGQATAMAVERAQRLSPYPAPPPHPAPLPHAPGQSPEFDALVSQCMAHLLASGQPPSS